MAEAGANLEAALALAEGCNAPFERALTVVALAELRWAEGDPPTARALLEAARAVCAPLDAVPTLARIDALAARFAGEGPPASVPGGLSAREVEVLRLVSAGLTDVQVARQLSLSPRTVGQHLRSVYNKLGVDNRAAATRFAVERGLT
jgi:DNA-binding NarL/FixJ family response regulator